MTPEQIAAANRSKHEIGRALNHITRQVSKDNMATVIIQDRADPTKIWLFSFEAALTTEKLAEHIAKGLAHIKTENVPPELKLVLPRASGRN